MRIDILHNYVNEDKLFKLWEVEMQLTITWEIATAVARI